MYKNNVIPIVCRFFKISLNLPLQGGRLSGGGGLILFLSFLLIPQSSFAADEIKVGTIERPPFSFHDENGKLTGFSIELWDAIANHLDIDYSWNEYKQFSKMVADVTANNTQMAIANISITSAREKEADFSHPIFESGMAIAVKKGSSTSVFTLIWESGILLFLGGAFLILLIIAHVVWFFERNSEDARHDYFRDDYLGGVWDAFWWAFIIMTMGGFENEVPQKILNRVIAMFWIIASLFFISTLTAKITTALTVAELQTGIQGYKDLGGKRVGVTKGSSHQKFLQKKGIKTIAYATLDQLYTDLKKEKLDAIVADYPVLSYYASREGAKWMQLAGESFNPDNYGIIFPENSPLIERVNTALLEIKEEGTFAELSEKYFGEK